MLHQVSAVMNLTNSEDEETRTFMDQDMFNAMLARVKTIVLTMNEHKRNVVQIQLMSNFIKGYAVKYKYLCTFLETLFAFIINTNSSNNFVMKVFAKQPNDQTFSLEFTIDGLTSNSFNSDILSLMFSQNTAELKEKGASRFPDQTCYMYLTHYLHRLLNIKTKVFGGQLNQQDNYKTLIRSHTPALKQMASQTTLKYQGPDQSEKNSLDSSNLCSLKMMLELTHQDLFMGKEIETRKRMIYDTKPFKKVLQESQVLVLTNPKLGGLVVNKNIVPEAAARDGAILLDWAAVQSFDQDLIEIKE